MDIVPIENYRKKAFQDKLEGTLFRKLNNHVSKNKFLDIALRTWQFPTSFFLQPKQHVRTYT